MVNYELDSCLGGKYYNAYADINGHEIQINDDSGKQMRVTQGSRKKTPPVRPPYTGETWIQDPDHEFDNDNCTNPSLFGEKKRIFKYKRDWDAPLKNLREGGRRRTRRRHGKRKRSTKRKHTSKRKQSTRRRKSCKRRR